MKSSLGRLFCSVRLSLRLHGDGVNHFFPPPLYETMIDSMFEDFGHSIVLSYMIVLAIYTASMFFNTLWHRSCCHGPNTRIAVGEQIDVTSLREDCDAAFTLCIWFAILIFVSLQYARLSQTCSVIDVEGQYTWLMYFCLLVFAVLMLTIVVEYYNLGRNRTHMMTTITYSLSFALVCAVFRISLYAAACARIMSK